MQELFSENQIRILCCRYERGIHPWIQDRLRTPYWRFYWNPTPGGVLWINGERVPLEPERFYLLPAYMEFSTRAEAPFDQFYIHFNLDDRLKPPRELHVLPAERGTMDLIRDFRERGNAPANAQLTMLTALAVVAPALLRLDPRLLTLPQEQDPRIGRVRKWLDGHRGKSIENPELARIAGMSCNGFCRLFRKEMGESPQSFVRRKRLEFAGELLQRTDLSIDEISSRCGFADRFHFSRVFRQVLNSSPAKFRRIVQLPAEHSGPIAFSK